MRLICPNCDAEYDVADDIIPPGGREVQCSNCTQTWFQTEKPRLVPSTPPTFSTSLPAAIKSRITGTEPPAPQPTLGERKPLEPSVADILREEAALHSADLDLARPAPQKPASTSAAQRSAETLRRISRITQEADMIPAEVAAAAYGAVEDQRANDTGDMPDINEINQALRARAGDDADRPFNSAKEEAEVAKRRSFNRGFMTVLLLIILAVLPYVFAADLMALFPAMTEALTRYVQVVDQARLQLNGSAAQFGAWFQGMIAQINS